MSGTLSYMKVLRLLPTGLCLYYVSHWFQWSYTRRRFGLYCVLIIAIRLFENMPGLILIYWCHLYHFKSTEQNEAKLAWRISWPNSRAFMHAKCTSTPILLPEPLDFWRKCTPPAHTIKGRWTSQSKGNAGLQCGEIGLDGKQNKSSTSLVIRSPRPTSRSEQDQLEQIAEGCIQSGFEYPQRWKLHNHWTLWP